MKGNMTWLITGLGAGFGAGVMTVIAIMNILGAHA